MRHRPAIVDPTHESQSSGGSSPLIRYPAGALIRVSEICGDRKEKRPGLLPIAPRTWHLWVEQGRVPQGVLLGERTRAWPVELILEIARNGVAAPAKVAGDEGSATAAARLGQASRVKREPALA